MGRGKDLMGSSQREGEPANPEPFEVMGSALRLAALSPLR